MRLRKVGSGRTAYSGRRATVAVALGVAAMLVMLGGGLTQRTTTAQAPAGTSSAMSRIAGKPDFSGVWQTMNTANWDLQTHEARPMVAQPGILPNTVVLAAPVVALGTVGWVPAGLGVVEGEEIPYQPWAAARKKENLANWIDRDPELKCFSPGVPRAMYMPYPFQIVQSNTKVNMVFEFNDLQRTIHLNKVEAYPNNEYMGYSTGRWEGDTLIVNSSQFSDVTWLDRAGNFHSDALKLVERFTPMGPNAIRYEVTIEDPQVFTRPWKIQMPLYRRLEQNAQLTDFHCVSMVEETVYGHLRKNPLVKHWEGKTMNVDITRKIPPGEEVHERYISGNPPAK